MAKPQLPIDVNEESGIWTTDELPMLYVPRHFFNNNHLAIEEEIGRDKYADILYKAGYKSAYFWMKNESKTHNIQGMAVYQHYLKRLSQRGWGLFDFKNSVTDDSIHDELITIELQHSCFALHNKKFSIHKEATSCYMFSGWFAGAADWVAADLELDFKFKAIEKNCASLDEDICVFEVCRL